MALISQDLGGVAAVSAITLDDNPGKVVKASEALLFGWHIKNVAAAATYVQVFNKATLASVTLGTTVPDFTIGIPSLGTSDMALPVGIVMNTGIVVFSTTTVGGSTAGETDCTFFYA